MKSFSFIFTLCAMIPFTSVAQVFAQPPDSLWSHTFGGSNEDVCFSVQETADGGYILAGSTQSFGAGYRDFWLVKTDWNGDSLWSRIYGGSGGDECYSVQQTSDGGYILAGTRSRAGWYDFWLVKTDANGDSLWSRTFGGNDDDQCYSVQQTWDGGYILGGSTRSFGVGFDDFWLVKTDANGSTLWSRTFGGTGWDVCHSVRPTLDGGYILAGGTESFGVGTPVYYNFWLVKTDANGDSLWSQTFGGSDDDVCFSVQQTSDGGYILAGYTDSFGAVSYDFWLVKADANGNQLWSHTFGGSYNNDRCYSVQQTSDGGYILGGYANSFGAGYADFWLVKTDANGNQLWNRTFGGSSLDWCNSVRQTSDGGYILGGETRSFGAGIADFWLVKTGPELSTEPVSISLPTEYALYPNYPNPFNPSTQIAYELPRSGAVSLKVFNVLGEEVSTLVNEVQSAGTHTVLFDGSGLASGIYLCRLQAGDFSTTKKMVLLK